MKKGLVLFLALQFCGSVCAQKRFQKVLLSEEDIQRYFDQYAVKGSIIIHDLDGNLDYIYDEEHVQKRFSPASTFKIFNSLVGLETGVIPDTSFVIPWDSVQRGRYAPWHRSNSMKSAFRFSVVWYYQELARRVGEDEMQRLVSLNHYGNELVKDKIDEFWLSDKGGKLRISQTEQIAFLKKLYHEQLNFSTRSQQLVKGIMLEEENPDYRIYAKTGMDSSDGLWYGWYVGWVESGKNIYFFATHLESEVPRNILSGARKGITVAILSEIGAINNQR